MDSTSTTTEPTKQITNHTPTPWYPGSDLGDVACINADGPRRLVDVRRPSPVHYDSRRDLDAEKLANRELILRAVNAHDDLVEAASALEQLTDAWMDENKAEAAMLRARKALAAIGKDDPLWARVKTPGGLRDSSMTEVLASSYPEIVIETEGAVIHGVYNLPPCTRLTIREYDVENVDDEDPRLCQDDEGRTYLSIEISAPAKGGAE